MELSQLQQFRAIAECGTITKAAEKLYLSQPALSMMLKKLENELGTALFVRKHNRLTLTEAGEMILTRVRIIDDQLDQIAADAKRFESSDDHISGMFCSKGVMWYYVPIFLKKYPEIHLDVGGFQESEEDANLLLERKTDFLVTSRPVHGTGIECVPFFSDKHYLSVPKNNRLAAYAEIGLDESSMEQIREILYLNQLEDSYCQKFLNLFGQRYPQVKLTVYSDYFLFTQRAQEGDLPVITTKLVMHFRKEGTEYVPIPFKIPELDIQYYLCYLKSRRKKMEAVLKWKEDANVFG